jgi:uncharacterized protein (TIGR00369 family)
MDILTHRLIDRGTCGSPSELAPGFSRLTLHCTPAMAVDPSGLVHGGFVFGLADHAAMLAVNHPNVVLASAEVKFLKPVVAGAQLSAEARVEQSSGRKHRVAVAVHHGEALVFSGLFSCFVPDRHVVG